MALLQKLKNTREVKENYLTLQQRFYGELEKEFPHIMSTNMADIANELQKELHLLLCSALRYKSVVIPLKYSGRDSKLNSHINVLRSNPGFYRAYSQRGISDENYMNMELYLKNDDIWKKKSYDFNGKKISSGHIHIKLSDLKNLGNRIIKNKLDAYFKLLREVMAYRKMFLCYVNEGRAHKFSKIFYVKQYKFELVERSIDIYADGGSHNSYISYYGYKYSQSDDDIERLLDYGERFNKPKFNDDIHDKLKFFINNYKEIHSKLKAEEALKRKACKTCNNFLKQIKVHTLTFKVLNELKK